MVKIRILDDVTVTATERLADFARNSEGANNPSEFTVRVVHGRTWTSTHTAVQSFRLSLK